MNAKFFGLVVAAFSIGQLSSSPLFGYWSSKMRFHKIPMLTCIGIMFIGNVIYAYLESIDKLNLGLPARYWMFISRLIMGIGAGKNLFKIFFSLRFN